MAHNWNKEVRAGVPDIEHGELTAFETWEQVRERILEREERAREERAREERAREERER